MECRKGEKAKGEDRKKARVKSRITRLIKRMDRAFRNKVANRREGEGCALRYARTMRVHIGAGHAGAYPLVGEGSRKRGSSARERNREKEKE